MFSRKPMTTGGILKLSSRSIRLQSCRLSTPPRFSLMHILLRRSFLFVVLYKMVAQKYTYCPSGSDDTRDRTINPNIDRYGFFANESKDSECFESGRAKSFKARKESGEQCRRRGARVFGRPARALVSHGTPAALLGGKPRPPPVT